MVSWICYLVSIRPPLMKSWFRVYFQSSALVSVKQDASILTLCNFSKLHSYAGHNRCCFPTSNWLLWKTVPLSKPRTSLREQETVSRRLSFKSFAKKNGFMLNNYAGVHIALSYNHAGHNRCCFPTSTWLLWKAVPLSRPRTSLR